jgi:WD40 repeat protein
MFVPRKSRNIYNQLATREYNSTDQAPFAFRSKVNKSDRNIQTLGNIGDLIGHRGCVNVISFNTTGSLLVSGSDDGTLKIWNVQTRKCLQTLTGHISNVFAGDFLPHKADRDIISGGNDADVRHYNLERSECTVYQHHAKKILRLSVCPSMPDCFLTASADGTVRLFDVRQKYSDTKTYSFSSDDDSAPEEMVLPQAFGGGRASRWEGHPRNTSSLILDWRRDSSFTRHNRNVGVVLYSVDFNPSQDQQFIVGSSQGNVQLFDLRKIDDCSPSKSYVNIYRNFDIAEPSSHEVTGCVFSKDGTEIVSTSLGEQIYTFDTNKNHEELYDLNYYAGPEERQTMLQKATSNLMETESTNPEPIPKIEKSLSTGLSQSEIQMASLAAYLVTHNYLSIQEAVNLNVHSPNNPSAQGATANQGQNFNSAPKVLPALKTYKRMFQGHFSASTIKGVNFYGPNSEYVMTGSDDAKVFIWDKATGELVQVLEGHKSIVNCIIEHPNIPMIASSGIDTEIKLWGPVGDYPNEELLAKRKHRRDRIKQINIEAYQNQAMYGSDEDEGGQVACQQQ